MKAVIQRVNHASVTIADKRVSEIKQGLLILLGITDTDRIDEIQWLTKKIVNLRIFNDSQGVMNRSVKEVNGEVIIVSQFTLMASTKKGNRPSYINAANSAIAIPLYQKFIHEFEAQLGKKVGTGEFGANMKIDLQNDGPVTITIDTENKQ